MSFFTKLADKIVSHFEGEDEEDLIDGESKLQLLHGRLVIHVIEAEDLPDTDTTLFNIDAGDLTDAYVTADLGTARLLKTRHIPNCLNPKWDEKFEIDVCHAAATLAIRIKDKEHIGASFVAAANIRVDDFIEGNVIDGWFDLVGQDKNRGRINLSVQYYPKEQLELDKLEVTEAYFPCREGNRIVLYQDADTPQLPQFDAMTLPDGSPYKATRAWKDLYDAINAAEKFIYITGWSVFTEICFVRGDEDPDRASNVGELLKRKAAEGVKVLLMVWNEKLSSESSPGLMGTHDEDTRLYFQDTDVKCALVGRMKRKEALASEFVSGCYTHHQKTVICDAPLEDGSGRKRIIAFVGGLDITDGRYDTPLFPLWSTINSLHEGDFYSNCVPGATKETGPRQPWHDNHAKVEGPIARDLMVNFEERWQQQADDQVNVLYHPDPEEFAPHDEPAESKDEEGGLFSAQLFRSITADSCNFNLERCDKLFSKDGRYVEDTIKRVMIKQIRRAEKFIYMENQYFLGSAYSWVTDRDALTNHTIPREICQRVIEKIKLGESFKAYICIPMFPEGDPSTAASQEILYWQYRTIEAMYLRIAKALKDNDMEESHPTDYLNFFCLGKRESLDEAPEGEFEDPPSGTLIERVCKSRRHPVYVHSKMSIFDDQYILIGSANVNERSLGGNRDSEIAVGAFQPDHTLDTEPDGPKGYVYTYRMALWAAHFGQAYEEFADASSDECLAKVKEVTRAFWEQYTAEEPTHSDVHMLPYPLAVAGDGHLNSLEKPFDCFPDTDAKVHGARSGYLPAKLTT